MASCLRSKLRSRSCDKSFRPRKSPSSYSDQYNVCGKIKPVSHEQRPTKIVNDQRRIIEDRRLEAEETAELVTLLETLLSREQKYKNQINVLQNHISRLESDGIGEEAISIQNSRYSRIVESFRLIRKEKDSLKQAFNESEKRQNERNKRMQNDLINKNHALQEFNHAMKLQEQAIQVLRREKMTLSKQLREEKSKAKETTARLEATIKRKEDSISRVNSCLSKKVEADRIMKNLRTELENANNRIGDLEKMLKDQKRRNARIITEHEEMQLRLARAQATLLTHTSLENEWANERRELLEQLNNPPEIIQNQNSSSSGRELLRATQMLGVYKKYFEERSKDLEDLKASQAEISGQNKDLRLSVQKLQNENSLLRTEMQLQSELQELNQIDNFQGSVAPHNEENQRGHDNRLLNSVIAENSQLSQENHYLKEKNKKAFLLVNQGLRKEITDLMSNLSSVDH